MWFWDMFLLVVSPVSIIPPMSASVFILILLLSEGKWTKPGNLETKNFFFGYRRISGWKVPSDFHSGVDELFAVLGHYAMLVGTYLRTFWNHCSFTL